MDPTEAVRRAQRLRKNMSEVEHRLWEELRARRIGYKFRRQHPIGPYIRTELLQPGTMATYRSVPRSS